jgi:hypothetical protein
MGYLSLSLSLSIFDLITVAIRKKYSSLHAG